MKIEWDKFYFLDYILLHCASIFHKNGYRKLKYFKKAYHKCSYLKKLPNNIFHLKELRNYVPFELY